MQPTRDSSLGAIGRLIDAAFGVFAVNTANNPSGCAVGDHVNGLAVHAS